MGYRELLRWLIDRAPSLVHVIAAALFATAGAGPAVAATMAYLLYQYLDWRSESESAEETQIDIVEWMIGLALGSLIRSLLKI